MSVEDDEIGELNRLIHELLSKVEDVEDLGGNFIEQLSARFDDSRAEKFAASPSQITWVPQPTKSPIKWLNQKVLSINFWSVPIVRMTQAFAESLLKSGVISQSQAEIFSRHTLVVWSDGAFQLVRPNRTVMPMAALSLLAIAAITVAAIAIIINQIDSMLLADTLALLVGLMMGRLGRHAFDSYWGRIELVHIIHEKYPWISPLYSYQLTARQEIT